jgi:hypothetical protein
MINLDNIMLQEIGILLEVSPTAINGFHVIHVGGKALGWLPGWLLTFVPGNALPTHH